MSCFVSSFLMGTFFPFLCPIPLPCQINESFQFLTDCRPHSVSMGNAKKFVRSVITKLADLESEFLEEIGLDAAANNDNATTEAGDASAAEEGEGGGSTAADKGRGAEGRLVIVELLRGEGARGRAVFAAEGRGC